MAEIFLGKPWHWGLLIAVSLVLALVGVQYLHTSDFNVFAAISLAVGAIMVCAVVFSYRPGDRVTREPIEDIEKLAD